MKLIHLSDLHLGKRVNAFSMIEDQKYILMKIINIIDDEKPDGILIAGDVYDRSIPTEEAMQLWDDFLMRLSKRNLKVFAISGNHDSAIRFADHNKFIASHGIHLSPSYEGEVEPISIEDEYGKANVYLLPFIKPGMVRKAYPDEEINDYTDACRVAIEKMNIDTNERNILVAHQFVTGAESSGSEELSVGGLDNVNASVFDAFDYVALGHIHGAQKIGRETVRYSGTPLKYSFSEIKHKKSLTVIEMKNKGEIDIRTVELVPLRDMREIRGTYDELILKENYEGTNTDDYIHAVLTDEDDVFEAMAKLRLVYRNIMKLSYDNKRTRENRFVSDAADVKNKSEMELFEEFFEMQNNEPMNDEQKTLVADLIKEIWGK